MGRDLSRRNSPSIYRRTTSSDSDPTVGKCYLSVEDSGNTVSPSTPDSMPDPPRPYEKREPPGNSSGAQEWLSRFGNDLFDVSATIRSVTAKPCVEEPIVVVPVSEVVEDIFQTEILSDLEKMIPMIADVLSQMASLSYEWEVQSTGMTIVIKPKEEDIDATKLFRAGKRKVEFGSQSPSKRMKMSPNSTMTSGLMEEDEGSSHLPNPDFHHFATPDLDQLEQKVNFDTYLPLINLVEEKPMLTSGNSIRRDRSEPAMSESSDTPDPILVSQPVLPKSGITEEKRKAFMRQTRITLDIIKKHPDDFVLCLRQTFGKTKFSKNSLQKHSLKNIPPPKYRNPGWNIRILAALAFNGPMEAKAIFEWVSNVFNHNRLQSTYKDEKIPFQDHMGILLAAKIVVVAETLNEQVFRLADFLLDEGMSKSESIASKIVHEYCHSTFLNVADEVEEVMNFFEARTNYDINAMQLWNEQFPNPSMAQMVTAAILFQGAKEEFVPISDVESFVEGCFLEWKMDARTKNELVTSLNCLNSLGILQVDLATQACKLCHDFDVIRVLVSNMLMTELFDLLPPPLSLSYRNLLILTYYILDPQRNSVHFQTAKKFLSQRFFSSSSNANSDRTSFSQRIARPALKAAILAGVLRKAQGTYCYILSDAMYDALDAHFKEDQERGLWPILERGFENEKGKSVEMEGGAPAKHEFSTIDLEHGCEKTLESEHESTIEEGETVVNDVLQCNSKVDMDKAECIAKLRNEPTDEMQVLKLAGEDTIIEAIDAVLMRVTKQTEEDTILQDIDGLQMQFSELAGNSILGSCSNS